MKFVFKLSLYFYNFLFLRYKNKMKEDSKGSRQERLKSKQKTKPSLQKNMKKTGDGQGCATDDPFEKIGNYQIYISNLIGKGTYGSVYKAKKIDSDQILACKIISKKHLQKLQMYNKQKEAEQLNSRIKTQSEFHKSLSGCKNIVKLFETIQNEKAFYFIMQFCESDLRKVIQQHGVLKEEIAIKYFYQMLEGYKSIYQRNAFHRDLKPENLLMKNDHIKISDFGFVKIFSEFDQQCRSGKNKSRTESKVGSIKYMSPDVLSLVFQGHQKTYSAQKSDIWSMGIILYKMLYGKEPFTGRNEQQMFNKINDHGLQFPDTVKLSPQLIINPNVSDEIKKLLNMMIEINESKRMNFKKLYSSTKTIVKQKELQKGSGIKQDQQGKEEWQGQAKNKREELIIVYNKLIKKIYYDAINYATLRELGVQKYYEISCKLMTLIHEKRQAFIENQNKEGNNVEINQKIKEQHSNYHNTFWVPIKNIANLGPQQNLQDILLYIYPNIKNFADFGSIMKQTEIFLLDLLLLLSLELKIVKADYVYTWTIRSENKKHNDLLKDFQKMVLTIERKLNPKIEQQQPKQKKKRQKTVEKKHESKEKRQKQKEQDNIRLNVEQVVKTKEKSRQKRSRERKDVS